MTDTPQPFRRRGARPLADILGQALSPVVRKRGFATLDLVAHWPDIVGPAYAESTAPDRLTWGRRPPGLVAEEQHEPATLTVRCTGAAALRFTHELPQVVERINMFFGYRCVGRVKLVQLPVARMARRARPRLAAISPETEARVRSEAEGIADDGLRAAVERLGRAVLAGK